MAKSNKLYKASDKVDQKIIDRSAKEFSDSIITGQLYKELKKDSEKDDDADNGNSEKRKANK